MRPLLLLLLLAVPTSVSAQGAESALVLVAGSPDANLERARAGAIEALAEAGVRLVPTPDGAECAAPECAAERALEAGADLALLVVAETTSEGGTLLRATLARDGADPEAATEEVTDAGIAAAAQLSVAALLERAREPVHGFLVVRVNPPSSAEVFIDGERAGTAPLRRMLTPRSYTVRVVPTSGGALEREVTVEAGLEETVTLSAGDEASDDADPATGPAATQTQPSEWNWIVGGGLAIVGIGFLIVPLTTLAQEGTCIEEIQNVGCVELVSFGPVSGVLMGIGLAALVAAVVVDAVAPFQVEVAAGPNSAQLRIRGAF